MAFHDVRFPEDILWGVTGGPSYSTTVLETTSGHEFRNRNWSNALRKWNVGHAVRTQVELDILKAFFLNRNGKQNSFRFKDWTDYKHDMSPTPVKAWTGDGKNASGATGPNLDFQLQKRFYAGDPSYDTFVHRPITKPIDPITLYCLRNFSPPVQYEVNVGVEATLSYSTGEIQWLYSYWEDSVSVSTGNPPTFTTAVDHGLVTGVSIYIAYQLGFTSTDPTQLWGWRGRITVTGTDTFTLDGVNITVVGSRLDFQVSPHDPEELLWEGEFDVPVRFDTDEMGATIDHFKTYSWDSVGIQEVRDANTYAYPEFPSLYPFHFGQLNPDIAFGAVGGPGFKTIIWTGDGGAEARSMSWTQARARYEIEHSRRSFDELIELQIFFLARWGKAIGFRFKDWMDYTHDFEDDPGPSFIAVGDDTVGPWQLIKTYASLGNYVRNITLPIVSGFVLTTVGAAAVSYTTTRLKDYKLEEETGVVTWDTTYAEDDPTLAVGATTVITCAAPHGMSTNESFYCSGASGTGAALFNGLRLKMTRLNTTQFSFAVDTQGLTVTGMDIQATPHTEESIYWEGEYDVPVRFDTDEMNIEIENYGMFNWGSVPLIEIRRD